MIKPITTPGMTYAVTSPNGCTVTQHVGEVDIVTDVPAGQQTLIIAHASKFEIDDDSAIVTECGGSAELVFTAATTRAASSGTGSDGMTAEERALLMGAAQRDADNTFTAVNTFTGAVDMSGASVTPPDGWNVADLTPEAIQQVVPMAWSVVASAKPSCKDAETVALGQAATTQKRYDISFGIYSNANGAGAISIGCGTDATGSNAIALGRDAKAKKEIAITLGAQFIESTSDGNVTHTCTTEGTGSITIGAGANTLNNGDAESSNSVTIGCKASNKGADSVVIGAQASGEGANSIVIGVNSRNKGYGVIIGNGAFAHGGTNVVLGHGAKASLYSTAIGTLAKAESDGGISIGVATSSKDHSICIGNSANAHAARSIAIGVQAIAADYGATVIRSTAENGTYTQLYFSGANTPLANTYENGEAMMGYVARDSAGNVMTDAEGNAMVGTQKLSVLFPNNRGENSFTPAMLGLDDEWTPKPMFRPSDLDMPQEEPTEPEEYQPLPVYPIVEPEIPEIEEV